jgi:hypothetical protein
MLRTRTADSNFRLPCKHEMLCGYLWKSFSMSCYSAQIENGATHEVQSQQGKCGDCSILML